MQTQSIESDHSGQGFQQQYHFDIPSGLDVAFTHRQQEPQDRTVRYAPMSGVLFAFSDMSARRVSVWVCLSINTSPHVPRYVVRS